jgi:hypothetical protein
VARKPALDLIAELAKPSFTPGQRHAPELVELVAGADDTVASRAAPALAQLGELGRRVLVAKLTAEELDDGARVRLVSALGLHARAGDPVAQAALVERVHDPRVRVRRAAALALGKLDGTTAAGAGARDALIARCDADDVPAEERRALAEALGRLGGAAALARLRALAPAGDAELARRRDRAVLMADRAARRGDTSEILVDAAPPAPVVLRLGRRRGLAPLLADELAALGIASRRPPAHDGPLPGELWVDHAGPLAPMFAARLWATLAIELAGRPAGDGDLAAYLVRAITAPATRALLAAWTRGPIRWRLGFASGHRRAVVWQYGDAT